MTFTFTSPMLSHTANLNRSISFSNSPDPLPCSEHCGDRGEELKPSSNFPKRENLTVVYNEMISTSPHRVDYLIYYLLFAWGNSEGGQPEEQRDIGYYFRDFPSCVQGPSFPSLLLSQGQGWMAGALGLPKCPLRSQSPETP